MTAASWTWISLVATAFANRSGQIAVGVTAGTICSGCGGPATANCFGNTFKNLQPTAEQSQSDTSICSGSESFYKLGTPTQKAQRQIS